MSTPQATRGRRGGSSTRAGRGVSNQANQGHENARPTTNFRGASDPRGRGRGASTTGANESARAGSSSGEGLLRKLREGTTKRGADPRTNTSKRGRGAGNPTPFAPASRGRGRGDFANNSKSFNAPRPQQTTPGSRGASPVPSAHRDLMNAKFSEFQTLKQSREQERAKAIRDGFLADPDKKTTLDKAITPVGTCTEMCPRFERVERIVQSRGDKAERGQDQENGKYLPDEDRMVKAFRRSAAGNDEQLPSDIRTPATLKLTLDYLLDDVLGRADRLATVHKFVWDRTRAIRNDFSIQQVTKVQEVKLAVECFEAIARFHILSLHQLSNPDNLRDDENFDTQQEKEQLGNTLLSLHFYYDDHGDRINFPNQAEFRAYQVILEIECGNPDIEDRIQSWPDAVLSHDRIKTALMLYNAASNTSLPFGPLHPFQPSAVAQNNTGRFWNVLASKSVPYLMACMAEHIFRHIRFGALDALWRSGKEAPQAQQAKSREWTLADVTDFLGFDYPEQTREFCDALNVSFAVDNDSGDDYLAFTANSAKSLELSSTPRTQIFSHKYVETKRYRRSLAAVIKGLTVANAIRTGSTASDEGQDHLGDYADDDDESLFVPEDGPATNAAAPSRFGSVLDATVSSFAPNFGQGTKTSPFGKTETESPFGTSKGSGGFGTSTPTGIFKSSQLNQESTIQKAPLFSQLGSSTSTAAAPSLPAPNFDKPAPFGVFGSTATIPPFESTSTFGNPNRESQPAWGPFVALGTLPAPPFTTPVQSGPQPDARPPIFGLSQPSKQPTTTPQPAAPVQGTSARSTIFSPSIPPSAAPSKPIFGQEPPAQQIFAPAPTPIQDNTTKKSEFVPPPSGSFFQPSPSIGSTGAKRPGFLFAPPDRLTSQSQSPQPPFLSGPLFQSYTDIPPEAPESAEIGQTPFKPFLRSNHTPKPSIERAPFFGFTDPAKSIPEKAVFTPAPTSPQPQRSTTPPYSPRQPPAKPVFTKADRRKLAANVARIGFTQSNGILSSFLEVALNDLLTTAFNQHQKELHSAAITSVRTRILARKFSSLWRQRAWNSSLNRRAKNRRQLFAETIKAGQARKQRSEEELEQILMAAQESRRLQKEIEEAVRTPKKSPSMSNGVGLVKVAGQKRKSFSGQDLKASTMAPSNIAASPSGHKRSKTMSTSMSTSEHSTSTANQTPSIAGFRVSMSRPQQQVSNFARSSILGKSTSNSSMRQSINTSKLDATRTDYFRLKAMGVDPDTPIIPDTKEILALRRKKEAEERQASINRASRFRTPVSGQTPPTSMLPPPLPQPPTPEAPPRSSRASTPGPVADEFLREIRQAREAMAEETQWLQQQSGVLEKEIEQEEEFRRSQSSRAASPLSSSGLAKVNGYEYLPSETKPGFSLSRTELRIRQTGAHGLATKSLRSTSDYVPVAMSKKSALKHRGESYSSPGRKRSHDDLEPSNETEIAHRAALHALKRARPAAPPSQLMAQKLKSIPSPPTRNSGQNAFQLLQSIDPEVDEAEDLDDEHDTDELFDEQDNEPERQSWAHQTYDQANGAYADDEEDPEDDEDLEEEDGGGYGSAHGPVEDRYDDEEEEDLEEGEGGDYQHPMQYYRGQDLGVDGYDDGIATTPASNLQDSRAASSAPGASVDDAFVIDDSD